MPSQVPHCRWAVSPDGRDLTPSSTFRDPSSGSGCWSGCEDPDFDADAVGDAGEVSGVTGDDGSLGADGGGDDDDGIHDVGGTRGGAGAAGGAAGALVVREYVAAFEHAGDLVLGSAAPGLGHDDDDGDDGADGADAR